VTVAGRSALGCLLALLIVAAAGCSSGRDPVASDTYLPPATTSTVSDTPADAGNPSAAAQLPTVTAVSPVLQAISTIPFTADQAQAVRAVPGVAAVARVGLGLITANVPQGARQLSVAAVDPLEFRPLAPGPTAEASFVWQGLLQGNVFLAHEEQPVLGVSLGTDLPLKGPKTTLSPRIGGLAANGVPNLAGGLISLQQAQALGLPGPTMLLVAITPGGPPTAIDARRVVDSGVAPVINTGIAHKDAGIGQIGAGIARAPLACFSAALAELGRRLGLAA